MTKEEIVKELDELGNVLYNKFGTDSYLERCTIHDLKTKIKALIIADVVLQSEQLKCLCCDGTGIVEGESYGDKQSCLTCSGRGHFN